MIKYCIAFIVTISLIITGCSSSDDSIKIAFIENVEVFEEFDMKKDYDKKIEKDLSVEMKKLSSLEEELNKYQGNSDTLLLMKIKKEYYIAQQVYNEMFQKLSSKYTNEVNDRLNEYIKMYSKEKGLTVILGSGGQGNVMYVDDKVNLTDDIIKYINKEYNN